MKTIVEITKRIEIEHDVKLTPTKPHKIAKDTIHFSGLRSVGIDLCFSTSVVGTNIVIVSLNKL